MQITILKNEKTEFNAKVSISPEVISFAVQKNLMSLGKKVNLPGFRPGKVPLARVAQKYGPSVRVEIIEKQINESINKIIKDNNLNIIGDPVIEELKQDEQNGVEFTLKCYQIPEIKLPDLKKIIIEKPVLEITDNDVQEELNQLAKNSQNYNKEKKGKAALKDQVTVNATAKINGEEFKGGELNNTPIVLGSNNFLPPFEDKLIGCKAGDEINLSVTFPPGYAPEQNLEGKVADFNVHVVAVHKSETPVLNDEFAQKFNCKTLDELKEQVKNSIDAPYAQHIHLLMKMHLFNQVNKLFEIEIPSLLVTNEVKTLKQQVGPIINEESSLKDKTSEELEEYFTKLALRRVKIGLMLAEYSNKKQLKIQTSDIQNAILAQARNFPGQEKQVIEFYQKDKHAIENLRGPILEEIAVNNIFKEEVTFIEKIYSKKELEKLINNEIDPMLDV